MTTVVNNPTPVKESGDNGGIGFLVGVVIIVIFLGVVLYYAIPAIRNMQPVQVNVPAPQINVETPEVAVPSTPSEPAPTQ
ncbi:hypothetical protein A2415_03835 [candidate division WWE3 bacterium RIFOXYC1_FULL_39_7]|uniref:Uncharacterized protein n=2 Tax=Katanobacteria TaxID=422282 RepID=A0A1F4X900_UNCKA|nr:MAG: hypothetical protein A2415_03835 [candidate division WWE3 bacterium RIFOXYC1_FULL_39_7]OGC78185.1 MAG: hypothetical protein A2619_01855 [candidate division WWE3 bacterium RIFOXYD1_FULL_39_9]